MSTVNTQHRRRRAHALALVLAVLPARAAFAQAPSSSKAPAGEQPAAPQPTAGEHCSAAYERSQVEKNAGHYVAARAAALECSQLQCNTAIVRECVRLYESLEQDTPTLVFSARKAEGGELIDVRVEMDGKLAAEQITGRPFAVDPGPHEFVFIHPQRGRKQVSETARVGERARVIEVTFVDPDAPAPPDMTPPPLAAAPPPARRSGGIPVMTYVLGGVGVLGLGGFVLFRVSGVNDYNEYNRTCSPACNPSDVDAVRQKFTFSYISLGVGIAGITGAGLVWALSPKREGGSQVQAHLVPRSDGATVGLRTRF
jgi:hypothetical protein